MHHHWRGLSRRWVIHRGPQLVAVHRTEATAQVLSIGVQQLNGLIGGELTPHRRHTHQQRRRTTVLQRSTGPRIQLQFTLRLKHGGQPAAAIAQGFGVGMKHRPPPVPPATKPRGERGRGHRRAAR